MRPKFHLLISLAIIAAARTSRAQLSTTIHTDIIVSTKGDTLPGAGIGLKLGPEFRPTESLIVRPEVGATARYLFLFGGLCTALGGLQLQLRQKWSPGIYAHGGFGHAPEVEPDSPEDDVGNHVEISGLYFDAGALLDYRTSDQFRIGGSVGFAHLFGAEGPDLNLMTFSINGTLLF